MALADIISRIAADAEAEAARITEAAEARAAAIREQADRSAEEHLASTVSAAERDAAREASRIVVNSRLGTRDETLVARHELVDEALREMERKLAEMPDDAYADFVAQRIAALAQGGEALQLGTADLARKDAIVSAIRRIRPELSFTTSTDAAPFERGARLFGDRVRADLSLRALIEERRDDLESVLVDVLFEKGA